MLPDSLNQVRYYKSFCMLTLTFSFFKIIFSFSFPTVLVDRKKVEIAVIPPFPYLRDILKILESDGHVKLGAQTSFFEPKGAFTGAVAASMLASCGVNYVLVGVI